MVAKELIYGAVSNIANSFRGGTGGGGGGGRGGNPNPNDNSSSTTVDTKPNPSDNETTTYGYEGEKPTFRRIKIPKPDTSVAESQLRQQQEGIDKYKESLKEYQTRVGAANLRFSAQELRSGGMQGMVSRQVQKYQFEKQKQQEQQKIEQELEQQKQIEQQIVQEQQRIKEIKEAPEEEYAYTALPGIKPWSVTVPKGEVLIFKGPQKYGDIVGVESEAFGKTLSLEEYNKKVGELQKEQNQRDMEQQKRDNIFAEITGTERQTTSTGTKFIPKPFVFGDTKINFPTKYTIPKQTFFDKLTDYGNVAAYSAGKGIVGAGGFAARGAVFVVDTTTDISNSLFRNKNINLGRAALGFVSPLFGASTISNSKQPTSNKVASEYFPSIKNKLGYDYTSYSKGAESRGKGIIKTSLYGLDVVSEIGQAGSGDLDAFSKKHKPISSYIVPSSAIDYLGYNYNTSFVEDKDVAKTYSSVGTLFMYSAPVLGASVASIGSFGKWKGEAEMLKGAPLSNKEIVLGAASSFGSAAAWGFGSKMLGGGNFLKKTLGKSTVKAGSNVLTGLFAKSLYGEGFKTVYLASQKQYRPAIYTGASLGSGLAGWTVGGIAGKKVKKYVVPKYSLDVELTEQYSSEKTNIPKVKTKIIGVGEDVRGNPVMITASDIRSAGIIPESYGRQAKVTRTVNWLGHTFIKTYSGNPRTDPKGYKWALKQLPKYGVKEKAAKDLIRQVRPKLYEESFDGGGLELITPSSSSTFILLDVKRSPVKVIPKYLGKTLSKSPIPPRKVNPEFKRAIGADYIAEKKGYKGFKGEILDIDTKRSPGKQVILRGELTAISIERTPQFMAKVGGIKIFPTTPPKNVDYYKTWGIIKPRLESGKLGNKITFSNYVGVVKTKPEIRFYEPQFKIKDLPKPKEVMSKIKSGKLVKQNAKDILKTIVDVYGKSQPSAKPVEIKTKGGMVLVQNPKTNTVFKTKIKPGETVGSALYNTGKGTEGKGKGTPKTKVSYSTLVQVKKAELESVLITTGKPIVDFYPVAKPKGNYRELDISKTNEETKTSPKLKEITAVDLTSKASETVVTIPSYIVSPAQQQQQQQKQEQQQQQQLQQIQTPRLTTPITTPLPQIPQIPFPIKSPPLKLKIPLRRLKTKEKAKSRIVGPVIPFGRRRGKFIPLSKPTTIQAAKRKGYEFLTGTLGATIEIRTTTGERLPIAVNTKEFGAGKKGTDPFQIVQRRTQRLKYRPEVSEIIASRRSGGNLWKF